MKKSDHIVDDPSRLGRSNLKTHSVHLTFGISADGHVVRTQAKTEAISE